MNSRLKKILATKKINRAFIFLLIFFSLTFIFPAGSLHSSATIENTSEYLSYVAASHTTNGKYVGMMIEPNNFTDKKVNNPYGEFHFLYGTFKEGLATYIGSANAEKSHTIKLKEIDEDINFSFLNVDSGFGVKEYYKDKDGVMVYKQEFYPLELMFYSNHPWISGMFSFFYISQSRAASILEKRGLPHETRDDYSKLLNTLTVVEIDGIEYNFAIDNIYYERNYFYSAINEVMGEFFCGGARYPEGIKRQGLIFLRNYPYQNKYFIEYATSIYSLDDFNFNILNYNFKDSFQIDNNKLVYVGNGSTNALSIILLVFAILLLVASLVLMFVSVYEFSVLNSVLTFGIALFPYLIFWIVHLVSNSAYFFSNLSIMCFIWCIIIFAIVYFILFLIKRSKRIKLNEKTTD